MKPPATKAPASGGFMLLEVIVALVILAAGLLAFYEFVGSALHAADRVRAAAEGYDRDQNALALVSTLNPMATPDGVLDLGTYRIRWHATPLTSPQQGAASRTGTGLFTVGLYRVVLDFPGDEQFAPVAVTKLGYHGEKALSPSSREPGN